MDPPGKNDCDGMPGAIAQRVLQRCKDTSTKKKTQAIAKLQDELGRLRGGDASSA